MRSGSLTLALSHSSATVDMRTGLVEGVSPGRELTSFSRNVDEDAGFRDSGSSFRSYKNNNMRPYVTLYRPSLPVVQLVIPPSNTIRFDFVPFNDWPHDVRAFSKSDLCLTDDLHYPPSQSLLHPLYLSSVGSILLDMTDPTSVMTDGVRDAYYTG